MTRKLNHPEEFIGRWAKHIVGLASDFSRWNLPVHKSYGIDASLTFAGRPGRSSAAHWRRLREMPGSLIVSHPRWLPGWIGGCKRRSWTGANDHWEKWGWP